jgi:hypothetical protein
MNKPKLTAVLVLVMSAAAVRGHAQAADDRRIQLGGGLGVVGSWWAGSFSGGDVRVSVPVSERGDVEGLVALAMPSAGGTVGFYGVQFKHRLGHLATSNVEPFVSCAAVGIFHREGHESMVTPPLLGLFGGGVERRVHRRLSLRFEAQVLTIIILPIGVRVAAGVSVPIGRSRPAAQ